MAEGDSPGKAGTWYQESKTRDTVRVGALRGTECGRAYETSVRFAAGDCFVASLLAMTWKAGYGPEAE